VVYARRALDGPVQVLRYLGRYTHRVAISNHRILSFDGDRVTFQWKDYAHGSKQRKMTLTGIEFLRRFFLHVLPKGFVRIRHFGFLANRHRTARLALYRSLVGATPPDASAQAEPCTTRELSVWHCPRCHAVMVVVQRYTPAEFRGQCGQFDSS
jgi:hypothetical protein